MTRLIVNNTDTAPGIFFPFQSITERDGEKCKPVATVNDFMIVIIQSLHEPIINSILFICLVYRILRASRVLNVHRHSLSYFLRTTSFDFVIVEGIKINVAICILEFYTIEINTLFDRRAKC